MLLFAVADGQLEPLGRRLDRKAEGEPNGDGVDIGFNRKIQKDVARRPDPLAARPPACSLDVGERASAATKRARKVLAKAEGRVQVVAIKKAHEARIRQPRTGREMPRKLTDPRILCSIFAGSVGIVPVTPPRTIAAKRVSSATKLLGSSATDGRGWARPRN